MDGMDHGHSHSHGGGGMAAPSPMDMHPHHRMMMMHMTFFWGKNTQVLFDGWPGTSAPMYALSLIVVFLLAAIIECLSHSRLIKAGTNHAAAALLRTLMHAIRIGLAYLVMLAIMSFNGGIFLAAVAGHALGFLFSGAGLWRKPEHGRSGNSDLPPMSC